MSDQIRQCPVCSEWRHISYFDVGERGCKLCQETVKSWLDDLAEAVAKQQEAEGVMSVEMLRIVREETCPESINPMQWRVLHMLDRGYEREGIAISFGISSPYADTLIEESLNALMREADSRLVQEDADGSTQEVHADA